MRLLQQSGVRGVASALYESVRMFMLGAPTTLVPFEYRNVLLQMVSRAMVVPGDILEVGVYRGGTLYRIADHVNRYHLQEFGPRSVIGIDTFEGHPFINENKDPGHHFKGLFSDTSHDEVVRSLNRFPFVRIIKGECSAAFAELPASQQFCLANLDVDIYESYVRCIEYVYPRLSPGGIIVCDEYEGYGHKEFVDQYFKNKPVTIVPRTGQLVGQDYGLIVTKHAMGYADLDVSRTTSAQDKIKGPTK